MRTDDGSIVQECLNGKPGAFGILVDKYKAGIYAFVYAELLNFHDAQDVTQEVFLQAYRGLHNLRRWESFAFWLYRIARNLCKKWIRTQSSVLYSASKDFILVVYDILHALARFLCSCLPQTIIIPRSRMQRSHSV